MMYAWGTGLGTGWFEELIDGLDGWWVSFFRCWMNECIGGLVTLAIV